MAVHHQEKCSKCGEYLVYTNGRGIYRTLNTFTLTEQRRVYLTPHECLKAKAEKVVAEESHGN